MKKIFLCVVLLLCAVIGNATAIWNGNGQGTESSPYEIWNLDRLNEVRNFVGDDGAGKYFRLEKDFDLAEYLEGLSWEPIGSSDYPFKGIFLGNGKKITGMTINSSSSYQGFFGYISGATIKDLTVEGTVKGAGYVGGIVGSSTGTNTIQNCTFNGDVTGSGSYVGGIVGSFTGIMNNVTHTGTTKGAGYVGGIVGQHNNMYESPVTERESITTATNTGNVTATSSSYVGGIAGLSHVYIASANSKGTVIGKAYTGGLAGESSRVDNCSADGPVTGTNYTGGLVGNSGDILNSSAKGSVNGSDYTGGLAGRSSTVTNSSHIDGDVSGSNYVGGLIGRCMYGPVTNGRHSNGSVSGTNNVGGLVGELYGGGSVTSCYSYANITGTDNVGGIVGCYTLSLGLDRNQKIESSGYFGNISARQYVGGVLGQIQDNGRGQSGSVTKPTTLHTYQTYGRSSYDDKTYQETLREINVLISIKNCAVVGDVIGTSSYVGGILGKDFSVNILDISDCTEYCTRYNSNHSSADSYVYYCDGTRFTSYSEPYTFTYYTYYYYSFETSVTDNYFSGNLKGTDYVGGVVGHMQDGTISRNHSYAAIEGSNKVGGIVGYMQADLNTTTTLSSNVTLNSTVTATSQAGKVYGYTTGSNLTIATSGTSINKTLNTTSLVIGGVTQETSNDAQNGTLQTQRMLLQSTAYSGLGWNFNSGAEWTSEESVSYPYKQWQTAPPTIKSGAVKGSTILSGTCTDNGTVYVTIEGNSNVYEATCSGGNWSLTVPTLKSGALIRAWSKSADKEQSYQTATTVSFPGSGTESDPWLVYDAYDLQGVNKPGYYKQMNDISLTPWISANSPSKGWVPVGVNSTAPVHYEGDNHKVTGLWTNTTDDYVGLFSNFAKGTICNLTVEVTSNQVKGGNFVGIVIGRIDGGTIENVKASGNVSGGNRVGGIAGYAGNTTLHKLFYTGQLTATYDVGGITQYASGGSPGISECEVRDVVINASGSSISVGGLVGYAEIPINNCKVTGTITLSGNQKEAHVGGLAGYCTRTISNCSTDVIISSNSANGQAAGIVAKTISDVKLCSSAGSITSTGANSCTGGIVGINLAGTAAIRNCYSTANVIGTGYVGGIAGYVKCSVLNSYATGSLRNTSNDGRAGGIVGFIEGSTAIINGCVGLNERIETGSNQWGFRIIGGTGSDITRPSITDNYGWNQMPILRNNATKTVYDDPYEGTAKTIAQLQQQSTYEALGWDFTGIWTMADDGYPKLKLQGYNINDYLPPYDLTDKIVNPTFSSDNANGWEGDTPQFQTYQNAEFFNRGPFDFHQTITGLPNGNYVLKVRGFCRPGGYETVYNDYMQGLNCSFAILYANSSSTRLAHIARDAQNMKFGKDQPAGEMQDVVAVSYDGTTQYLPNTMRGADYFFSYGLYENELPVTVSDGTLTIGIRIYSGDTFQNEWVIFDDFRLICVEPDVMKGDLNGDGEVSITDVVLIIDVIAGVITDANQVAAADVNNDGEVTITDCVAAIDLIAEQQSSGARRAGNVQLSAANGQWSTTDFISASMQDKMLNVCLDNERSYTAFQMVVTMPEGMTLARATMDSERGGDHQVTLRDLGNGQYLVAGFSMDNDKLAGNSGRLLSIVTDGQEAGSIVISNVEFATAQAEGYRLKDAVASSMTTGVSEMVNSDSSNSKYYDLQGRRVAAPAKGLYIVNGKKINLK